MTVSPESAFVALRAFGAWTAILQTPCEMARAYKKRTPGGVDLRGFRHRRPVAPTGADGPCLILLQRVSLRSVVLQVMNLVGAQQRRGRLRQLHRDDEILDSGRIRLLHTPLTPFRKCSGTRVQSSWTVNPVESEMVPG